MRSVRDKLERRIEFPGVLRVLDARKHPVASFGSAKPERDKRSGLRNSRYRTYLVESIAITVCFTRGSMLQLI